MKLKCSRSRDTDTNTIKWGRGFVLVVQDGQPNEQAYAKPHPVYRTETKTSRLQIQWDKACRGR